MVSARRENKMDTIGELNLKNESFKKLLSEIGFKDREIDDIMVCCRKAGMVFLMSDFLEQIQAQCHRCITNPN